MKFYRCSICGKIVAMVEETKTDTICCGMPMVELIPNTSDGAFEKHIPVIEVSNNVVSVSIGEVPHPMIDAHYIKWVVLITDKGNQRKLIHPGDAPIVEFYIGDDERVIETLEYCNLHGLYSKKL